MKYTVEQGEKSTVKVAVTLTAKEWNEAQTVAYNKTKGKYQVQGFRKGHVPKAVIEQFYGKGVFYEDAINEAFSKYYFDILDKEPSIERRCGEAEFVGHFFAYHTSQGCGQGR